MSEITGAVIDEFSSLTLEQQDRIIFHATSDPEATKRLFESIQPKLSKRQEWYLDSDVGISIHEYAVTTLTLPPKKPHKQPFWTKDWRKRR